MPKCTGLTYKRADLAGTAPYMAEKHYQLAEVKAFLVLEIVWNLEVSSSGNIWRVNHSYRQLAGCVAGT